jgi:diguanylate cyclase (GGDEF)-like protein/PAS domain S-box-containing protein
MESGGTNYAASFHPSATLNLNDTDQYSPSSSALPATWVWLVSDDVVHLDEQSGRLLGSPGATALRHEEFVALLHHDDRPLMRRAFRNLLDGLPPGAMVCRPLAPGGPARVGLSAQVTGRGSLGDVSLITGTVRAVPGWEPVRWPGLAALNPGEIARILDLLDVGAWHYDARSDVIRRNRRWAAMLGYAPHEPGTDLASWLDLIHPEDRNRIQAELALLMRAGPDNFRQEYRIRCGDGSYRWMTDRGFVLERDRHGTLLRSSGLLIDITDQVEARQALQTLSSTDPLTGVGNRRTFDLELRATIQAMGDTRRPVSLLLIDVDRFKRYNDHYGHLAGDDCLRRVADALCGALDGGQGRLARYGGEEFAVILPDLDAHGAHEVAERLLHAVETLHLPHETCGPGLRRIVTISIGRATLDAGAVGDPRADILLLAEADAALYAAKQRGRNRIGCVAPARTR